MTTVSRYQRWLVADHIVRRIEGLGGEVSTFTIAEPKFYSRAGFVHISMDWPYTATLDEQRAFAQQYVDQYGGEYTDEERSYSASFNDIDIEFVAAHGIRVTLHVVTYERPVKSEQDGDEAEALNT